MSNSADNYFSCSETPANFPTGLKLVDVPESSTSKLRIISKIPGPGNYSGPIDFFYDVNENPTTSVHFNGFMYNLAKCYLCIPGVHKIAGETKVCDAELVVIFNPSQTSVTVQLPIMMCIPVESGIRMNSQSAKYFATLGTGVTPNRPTFGSILQPKSSFVTYNAFNFMLRLSSSGSLKKCSDIPVSPTNIMKYFICQKPIGMAVSDFDRFKGYLPRKPRPPQSNDYTPLEQLVKPPVCDNQISNARYALLSTRITNVKIEAPGAGDEYMNPTVPNGISTDRMKCKTIRPRKKGGLRVDMTKDGKTLKEELKTTQDNLNTMDLGQLDPGIAQTEPTKLQHGDIERGLATFLGILVSISVCAAIAFLFQKFVFPNYLDVVVAKETPAVKIKIPTPPSLPKISFPDIPKMLCPKD